MPHDKRLTDPERVERLKREPLTQIERLRLHVENDLSAPCLASLLDEVDALSAALEAGLDGSRPIPIDREQLGRFVREAWVRWAKTQPNPKPSWLVDYDELSEPDKEADRQIGEAVARWTLIHDAAARAMLADRGGE